MRIIIVRHGETNWNREGRVMGLSDLELNENGKNQAELMAQSLSRGNVASIYTSPLKRALETAHIINRFHQVKITTLDGLRELDAGEVDGLTYHEIQKYYGDFFERWMNNCAVVRPPGGCTVLDVQNQAWAAMQEIIRREKARLQENEGKAIIVVSHFFPIRAILCKAMNLDLSQIRRIRLDLASISILDFNDDGIELTQMNDVCHWKEGQP